MNTALKYDLERFIKAQDNKRVGSYTQILELIRNGEKVEKGLWHIFPRYPMEDSRQSGFFGFEDFDEATLFYAHPVLRCRLREISQVLLSNKAKPISAIFGNNDVAGIHACMTLFDKISPNDIFAEVLDVFFASKKCENTLSLISADTRTLSFELQIETTDVDKIDNIVKENFREFGDIVVSQSHYRNIKQRSTSLKAIVYKANIMNEDLLHAVKQALATHVWKSLKYSLLVSVIYGEKNEDERVRCSFRIYSGLNTIFKNFIKDYFCPDWRVSNDKSGIVFTFVIADLR